MNSTLLNNKTVKELREVAKELGLKGVSRLTKADMIQAILNKVAEQTEIVNNIAEVHKLAKNIIEQEAPTTWTRQTGEHDTCIITRALAKLNATSPLTLSKGSHVLLS